MRASLQADCRNLVAFCQKFRYNVLITYKIPMKNLSQIPRKVSAKFCYSIDQLGQSENIESKDFVPYTFENNDTRDVKPTLTESEQKTADALVVKGIEDDIEVTLNLKDSALVNNNDVKQDLAADVPVGLFRKFFTGNPLDDKLMEKVVSLGTTTEQEATDRFGFENWVA